MSDYRLRILVVSPDLPFPPSWGFATRVYQLVRHLAARHDVTLLCYARADQVDGASHLRELCRHVRVVPRQAVKTVRRRGGQFRSLTSSLPFQGHELRTSQMQQAIDELLSRSSYDVVQVESSQMCGFSFRTSAAVVLDEHNVEYELLRRMHEGERSVSRRLFNLVEYAKFRRLEQHLWNSVEACVLTSDREEAIVRRYAPRTPTAVVPNAVDPAYFAVPTDPPDPDTMVFTGLLTYRPNLDAAWYLVDQILPAVRRERPGATLTVVGHGRAADLRRLRRPGVIVTGQVPDVRPYMARAAVALAPIRIGSGTRLKVVEALSMAKPVVSTGLGCEGIKVRGGDHLLIADDAASFVAAAVELLSDQALASRLGRAGRTLIEEHYSWRQAAAGLEDLYYGLRQPTLVPAGGARQQS